MRIKSLELLGFKSFYDKTSIQYRSGINAIVGPNGCGKSNIIDAIRWILGEQNPRRLRAENMEELISNGGDVHKPVGMAEVTLVISGVGTANLDEIVIKRRVFRSGEHEFYINGIPCRLKDITEAFLDEGVGARSYSIISQGRVEQVISGKPEEIRSLIEEVAGIIKYKVRRRETESKIKSTIDNLARVRDVVREINQQMNVLSRQARDADEFRRISEELRRTELRINRFKLHEIEGKIRGLSIGKVKIEGGISSVFENINNTQETIKESESNLIHLEESLEVLENGAFKIKSVLQAKESFQERARSEISAIDEYIGKIEREIELLVVEKEKSGALLEVKENNLKDVEINRATVDREANRIEESIAVLREQIRGDRSEIDGIRVDLFEALDKHSSIKATIVGYEKELNELKTQRDRLMKENKEVQDEREKIFKVISVLEDSKKQIEDRKGLLEQNNNDIQKAFKNLNQQQEVIKKENSNLEERFKEVNSRLSVLKQIQTNYEWLPEGVRRFILERKGNGLLGLTSDFISVEKGYERAIEAALGEKLKWIFVKESEEALSAVESLRELSVGRVTFIPIGRNKQRNEFSKNGHDILPIWEKIAVDGIEREVIDDMLSGVFLVSSLKEAMMLRDEIGGGASFVTVDGDYLDSTGAMSGGLISEGVFERKREIEELYIETINLEEGLSTISFELESKQIEIEDIKNTMLKQSEELLELEIKDAEVKKDISNVRENLLRLGKRSDLIEFELKIIDTELQEKEKILSEANSRLKQFDDEKTGLGERFSLLEVKVKAAEDEEVKLEEQISNLRVEIATLFEKQKGLIEDLDELGSRYQRLTQKIERENGDIARKMEERSNLMKLDEEAREDSKKLLGNLKLKEGELSAKKAEKEELLNKIRLTGEHKEGLRLELASLQEKSHSIQMQINGLQIELEHLEVDIGKSVSEIKEEPVAGSSDLERFNLTGEEERLRKLKERVDRFGPVNLLAPEEFNKLEERYNFLNDQIEDLTSAVSSLRKAMHKIDKESSKRFIETFEVVNKKFQETFTRLFRGGEAKLVLVDPEDILNTGVDIMVRPKGKGFQSINLLSGGEKALSAIALVISASFVRPAPFFLFDEIDAPLDDVNTTQFVDLITEISKESQILIITHNKKTMQAVNSLIGITSDKPGISKVVSVELQTI